MSDSQGTNSGLVGKLEDIDRIAKEPNSVLRNLLITQRYHDLSLGLAGVLGKTNVNWSTFACWASLTAGESIRSDQVPGFILELIKREQTFSQRISRTFARWFAGLGSEFNLFDEAAKSLRAVSASIALGNKQVFEELGPLFLHFIDVAGRVFDNAQANAELAQKVGNKPLLNEAFSHYFEARHTEDSSARAQWILFGNAKIGLHEQTRLQGPIEDAVSAPVDEILLDHIEAARNVPLIGGWLERSLAPVTRRVREEWQEVATRHALNLSLPRGTEIPLGKDVPRRQEEFPKDLAVLTNPALKELLKKYDEHLDTLLHSGSNNWVQLNDRMGFIVDLFRSRQQDQELFDQPFKDGERADIESGKIPPTLANRFT